MKYMPKTFKILYANILVQVVKWSDRGVCLQRAHIVMRHEVTNR